MANRMDEYEQRIINAIAGIQGDVNPVTVKELIMTGQAIFKQGLGISVNQAFKIVDDAMKVNDVQDQE